MRKLAMATMIALATGTGTAQATAWQGEFCMYNPGGGAVSDGSWGTACDEQVSGVIDTVAHTFSVSSPQSFFFRNWTAHDGVTFGPGTYTIATVEGGTYTGITVGAGQVGGHILFDWGVVSDIDVVMVWDVTGNNYTSTDWDGDGIAGGKMIDGAFVGFSANFNMQAVPVPAAVWLFGSGLLGLIGVTRRRKR